MNINSICIFCFFIIIGFTTQAQQTAWDILIDTSTTFSSPRAAHLNGDTIKDIVIGGGLDGQSQSSGIVALDGQNGQFFGGLLSRKKSLHLLFFKISIVMASMMYS